MLALISVAICGCSSAPGRPALDSQVLPPDKVLNFERLYQQNCAGCHGAQGKGGAAVGLATPVYLAVANDATIRRVTAEGIEGTAMPAFAQSSGGMLTDEQVNAIVGGIRSRWATPHLLDVVPPSYSALAPGDPTRGFGTYNTYCLSCHGAAGRGGPRAGSIVDESYLKLVSDQYLRTIVITGRPEMGAPDWRSNVPGKPMSQEDVSDVVAWLSTQRPRTSNHVNSAANPTAGGTQ